MPYRKTVREIVAAGISTVAELQEALLNAIAIGGQQRAESDRSPFPVLDVVRRRNRDRAMPQ